MPGRAEFQAWPDINPEQLGLTSGHIGILNSEFAVLSSCRNVHNPPAAGQHGALMFITRLCFPRFLGQQLGE